MEQVLEVYRRPYDSRRPVVCMDEQPKQLIDETRAPLPAQPGQARKVDFEYIRNGVCCVWMFVEPLAGWRQVEVTPRRTSVDWAQQVRALVDAPCYAQVERITLVCDNLNTHRIVSLYQAFEAVEAMRVARKLELVHTPKHGSWLNMAEPELSVLTRQCLRQYIGEMNRVARLTCQWVKGRNERQTGIDWQFRTEDARIKLKYLYQKFEE